MGHVHAWMLAPGRIDFELSRTESPSTDEIDRAWEEMARENPRLFDGPFLSVERFDPSRAAAGAGVCARFTCRVERYRRLAVAPRVETGVRMLALTGVVTARDASGSLHVLMGLRAGQTRMYGGLWEFAPAGGVDPPAPGGTLDEAHLARTLAHELEEEVGLPAGSIGACAPVMVVLNEEARSYDVVMRAELSIGLEEAARRARAGSWEYERVEWVPVGKARLFASGPHLVPQGRAMAKLLAA